MYLFWIEAQKRYRRNLPSRERRPSKGMKSRIMLRTLSGPKYFISSLLCWQEKNGPVVALSCPKAREWNRDCDETVKQRAPVLTHTMWQCVFESVRRQVTSLTHEASSLYSKTEVCCGNCYITPAVSRTKTCCYERSALLRLNTSQRPNKMVTLGQRADIGLTQQDGAKCTGYSGIDWLGRRGPNSFTFSTSFFFKWNMLYKKSKACHYLYQHAVTLFVTSK